MSPNRNPKVPEEFNAVTNAVLVAAIRALEAALDGNFIVMIGCDAEGKVYALPNPACPGEVVVEVLTMDWSGLRAVFMEHLPAS